MDGAFIPEGLWSMQPAYINLFENVTMVQFNHRLAAYILTVITMFYAYYGIKHAAHAWQKRMFYLLIAVFSLQILLGIATLLMAVPLILATLHQLNALFLFGICILLQHGLKRGAERYKLSSRERLLVGT